MFLTNSLRSLAGLPHIPDSRRGAPAAAASGLAVAGLAVVAAANPAAAHGVGGRSDLPLPLWQVVWASACVVAVSFAAVGLLWRKPILRTASAGVRIGRGRARESARRADGRHGPLPGLALAVAARAIGLAAFAVVLFAALRGNDEASVNIAPVAVYVVFWVGMPALSVLLGDVWQFLNPMPVLAAAADRLASEVRARTGTARGNDATPRHPPRPTRQTGTARGKDAPAAAEAGQPDIGHWWAAATLAGFVWLELAYFESDAPRAIALYLLAYTAAIVMGSALRGREWARSADGFSVLFGYCGAMGISARAHDGRMLLRWPVAGLSSAPVRSGTGALILVVLGATAFDGLTGSSLWLDLAAGRRGWELTAYRTAGLLFAVGAVFVVYRAAIAVMAIITGDGEQELSDLFVPSLVPICAAYIVAHYFSLFVFQGQKILAHASDPFGRGWDLFGTATNRIDYTVVSTDAIAWVQTTAIVVGHVLAVVVAHDRAVERYPHGLALRSQYPMLLAMIAFTVAGLMLLLSS